MTRPDVGVMRDLLARVAALTGPCRDTDEAIMRAFYFLDERHMGEKEDSGLGGSWVPVKSWLWIDPRTDKWVCNHAFRFTEDESDNRRLLSFLPGGWQVSTTTPDPTRPASAARAWAKIQPYSTNDEGWEIGGRDCSAPTVALALTQAALVIHVAALITAGGSPDAE